MTLDAKVSPKTVRFTVPGKAPSKANFRWDRKPGSREKWRRIKAYEQEVGLAAMAAGAKRHAGSGRVFVRILLLNQRCDPDNACKVALDGIKGVAMPDDSGEHVRGVQVVYERDDGPVRAEYAIEWEV